MKRLLFILTIALLCFSACNKTYDLQGIRLGDERDDFIVPLSDKTRITYEEDNELWLEGDIPAFGTIWNKGIFKFKDDRLTETALLRPFSSTSESTIENIKSSLRDYCGDAYSHYERMTVLYGTDKEKDCQGSLTVNTTDDNLFVTIKIIE